MKYVVTKEQFDKAVIKLLHSFIGKITYKRETDSSNKKLMYYELYDKDKENFADIWGKGYGNKGCKRELRIFFDVMANIEQFMPDTVAQLEHGWHDWLYSDSAGYLNLRRQV